MSLRHRGNYPPLPALSTAASGSNLSINLCNEPLGTVAVGLGVIAADVDGPIGVRPTDQQRRSMTVIVDNTAGAADAYLARPEDIPTAGTETAPLGALVVPAGASAVFDDYEPGGWPYILRLIDGADVRVTVLEEDQGW